MKKIIAILCLVLSLLLVVSCSKSISYSKYYENEDDKDNYPKLTKNTVIESLSSMVYKTSVQDILVFENSGSADKSIYFYYPETDKILRSLTTLEKDLVDYEVFKKCNSNLILLLTKETIGEGESQKTEYTVTLYTQNGDEVASKKLDNYTNSSFDWNSVFSLEEKKLDLFIFNNKIYRIDTNGNVQLVVDNPFFNEIYDLDFKTNSYYYNINNTYSSNSGSLPSAVVYNHDLERVFFWEAPHSSFYACNINVLSSEKLLIQLLESLPFDSKKYDVFYEGAKMNLTSLLVDVKNGKEKEIKLDYIIESTVYSSSLVNLTDTKNPISSDVTDVAIVSYIEDKKVLSDTTYVSLKAKNAKIRFEISPELDNLPTKIAKERWIYETDSGEYYMLDNNGNIIATVSSDFYNSKKNASYIAVDGKLYDYSFKIVYDYEADNKNLVTLLGHNAIFSEVKDGETIRYLYTSSGLKELDNYHNYLDQHYVIRNYNKTASTYDYFFYNEYGEVILEIKGIKSSDLTPSNIYTYEDNKGFIVQAMVNGQISYYKVS